MHTLSCWYKKKSRRKRKGGKEKYSVVQPAFNKH